MLGRRPLVHRASWGLRFGSFHHGRGVPVPPDQPLHHLQQMNPIDGCQFHFFFLWFRMPPLV